jgi:Pvc16 N-terminal domain/Carboxypeptidase regulatory-like domain
MLDLVDTLIQKVLDTGWTATPPPAKPGFFFTVPDQAWKTKVLAGMGMRLNIYLYEIRENRNFRRAEWDQIALPDRTVVLSQPPVYLDCHYLISAWSSTEDSEITSPVLDEHQTLAEAMRVLLRNPDVVPGALGLAGGVVFQNAHVYLTVAPPEPPRVLNDFWSTMQLAWRPAVMLVVTAPLDLLLDGAPAPIVTTLIQRYALIGTSGLEQRIDIGGFVVKAADGSPIANATVNWTDASQAATTDSQGRYIFTGILPGVHNFIASAPGMTPINRNIDIPADPPATHIFQLSP